MKTIKKCGFQGDVGFFRVDKLPTKLEVTSKASEPIVVAHSETGHHHSIHGPGVELLEKTDRDPLVCYLRITAEYADVVHHRDFDTHQTVRLTKGLYEVRRQREYVPEGWRRVED